MFDLVIDGVIYGDKVYNKYRFAAVGTDANGKRFNESENLGITKINDDEYNLGNLAKFLAWAKVKLPETIAIYGVKDGNG